MNQNSMRLNYSDFYFSAIVFFRFFKPRTNKLIHLSCFFIIKGSVFIVLQIVYIFLQIFYNSFSGVIKGTLALMIVSGKSGPFLTKRRVSEYIIKKNRPKCAMFPYLNYLLKILFPAHLHTLDRIYSYLSFQCPLSNHSFFVAAPFFLAFIAYVRSCRFI